jgi:hypothetical protein
MMAKYYHFDLLFGCNRYRPRPLDAGAMRKLEKLMWELDGGYAPSKTDIYHDGILYFSWKKPPAEQKIVDSIKTMGVDFWYRFVPDGNVHIERDCQNCDYDGPMQYGWICPAVPADDDWKFVTHSVKT